MSRGIGVRQLIILEILGVNHPDPIYRNRLNLILTGVIYKNSKSKVNLKSLEYKLFKERKSRVNKLLSRDLASLKKRKLIIITPDNKHLKIGITQEGINMYENKYKKYWWKTEKDFNDHNNRISYIGYLLTISRRFDRSRINQKKHIKTPFSIIRYMFGPHIKKFTGKCAITGTINLDKILKINKKL